MGGGAAVAAGRRGASYGKCSSRSEYIPGRDWLLRLGTPVTKIRNLVNEREIWELPSRRAGKGASTKQVTQQSTLAVTEI